MHLFWDSIIRPLLELLGPKRIVEIGVFRGEQARRILKEYCAPHEAVLHGIDPVCTTEVSDLIRQYPLQFVFHEQTSLEALQHVLPVDVVLIDGDHNWYTVRRELTLLAEQSRVTGTFPCVMLHDVDWPYGRRDAYTDPAGIPAEYRQPFAQGGVTPQNDLIVPDAGLNPDVHHALYVGVPRNGVRTAVEDFLRETGMALSLITVPGLHGLGILLPQTLLERRPEMRIFLESLHTSAAISAHIHVLEYQRTVQILNAEMKARESLEQQHRLRDAEQQWANARNGYEKELLSLRADLQKKMREYRQMQWEHNAEKEQTRRICETQIQTMREILGRTEANLRDRETELARMLRSRSWRWTRALRRIDGMRRVWIRNAAYGAFGGLKDMWTDFGEPLPGLVRFIRHGILGKVWPASTPTALRVEQRSAPVAAETLPILPDAPFDDSIDGNSVSVVIPCHNYGRYLGEAIDSVLRQSVHPREIIVVDDASEDDTPAIASRYARAGVRYLRGEWRSVGAARNAGLAVTTSPLLVFLDADNMLHPAYLQRGIEALRAAPEAAIAYPDQQCFGDRTDYYHFPDAFDWRLFDRQNHMDTVAMVRRDALMQAGGWSHGVMQDGDWITWRRILRLGWGAVRSHGLSLYRMHGKNMIFSLESGSTYAERAGLLEEQATLCIALSGRKWAWPLTVDFLSRQTFPHDKLHLIVLDTSDDPAFGAEVKRWLEQCDYAGTTYLHERIGEPGLADHDRSQNTEAVCHACARIYNTFAQHSTTPLTFLLEDDVLPPLDAYPRLVRSLGNTVLSVGAAYRNRSTGKPIGWKLPGTEYETPDDHPQEGVSDVFGSGLGCTVFRTAYLKHHVFRSPAGISFDYDFFARTHEPLTIFYPNALMPTVHENGWRTLTDWDCVCRHYSDIDTWI